VVVVEMVVERKVVNVEMILVAVAVFLGQPVLALDARWAWVV